VKSKTKSELALGGEVALDLSPSSSSSSRAWAWVTQVDREHHMIRICLHHASFAMSSSFKYTGTDDGLRF
jgi:hypothetical protein